MLRLIHGAIKREPWAVAMVSMWGLAMVCLVVALILI